MYVEVCLVWQRHKLHDIKSMLSLFYNVYAYSDVFNASAMNLAIIDRRQQCVQSAWHSSWTSVGATITEAPSPSRYVETLNSFIVVIPVEVADAFRLHRSSNVTWIRRRRDWCRNFLGNVIKASGYFCNLFSSSDKHDWSRFKVMVDAVNIKQEQQKL